MSRLFRSVEGGELFFNGSVVCIGVFDGFYLGYCVLVCYVVVCVCVLGVVVVVVVFELLLCEFFFQGMLLFWLILVCSKVEILCEFGVDVIGLLCFDVVMVVMLVEIFVYQLLVQCLSVCEVWIGLEFCFGNCCRGDLVLLQQMGVELGFSVGEIEVVDLYGECIFSICICQLLQDGDFVCVNDLFGCVYVISGWVVCGCQFGCMLGFFIVNLCFLKILVLLGIYVIWVYGVFDQLWLLVFSFGIWLMVEGVELLLEVYLFDFQGDLYGCYIDVEFVVKLCDEEKFNDLVVLIDQMYCDVEQVCVIFFEYRL